MLNQNAENATKQSTTGYGAKDHDTLKGSESTKQLEYSAVLDPVQEIYKSPDNIEEAEQMLADCEAQIDYLTYSKDVMYHSLTLEFMKKRPTATSTMVKSMVTTDEKMNKLEIELQAARKKCRAAKVYFNKMRNIFYAARKLVDNS